MLSDVKPRTTRLWAYRKTLKRTEGIHANIRQTLTTGKKVRKLQRLLSTGEKEKLAFHTEFISFYFDNFSLLFLQQSLMFFDNRKTRARKENRTSVVLSNYATS